MLNEILTPYLAKSIANNDTASSALFANLLRRPLVFITAGSEAAGIAGEILKGKDVKIYDNAVLYNEEAVYCGESLKLYVGQELDINDFKRMLEKFNTEYEQHGDIIDIGTIRIMFDNDIIEGIKVIDPVTLKSTAKLDSYELKSKETVNKKIIDIIDKNAAIVCDGCDVPKELCGGDIYKFRSREGSPFPTMVLPNYYSAMSILTADITRAVGDGKTVILFAGSSKTAENYLREKRHEFFISKGSFVKNKINIVHSSFPSSVELRALKLCIYSLVPMTASAQEIQQPAAAFTYKTQHDFIIPPVGDCIVHSFHGIGRYLGVKKMDMGYGDEEQDYFVIQYDGGAVVYLPTTQTDILSNYVGEPSRLHRIGGQDFANAKQRVKRHLRELSFKLREVYAKRAKARAHIYEINKETDKAFADSFEFEHTDEQEKVLSEIYADMQGNKIMDRLVCGDVGYGKTEVAFRTAFNAVMNGYQVMLLCPTTILSVQHYNLAAKRFKQFGIRTAVLNRFIKDKDYNKIVKNLASGEIDIIIGTHRLLSLTPENFKHLGLLIIDEEQRFGVETKEKIKKLTHNIDVLTMSATPIPRTLNMSLMGLRDISILQTPPASRLPVITKVEEFSEPLLVKVIQKEFERGGQTIILYNNIQTIENFTVKLRALFDGENIPKSQSSSVGENIPKIDFVHGQMNAAAIEDIIAKVYEKETDVIIASTIIENGIDISTANTLFVVNADKLGVAQMHQLRGRVGRGAVQAYAYFTYAKEELVTAVSMERINAIKNFYSSGAGFNIAMRDLELRGGGEILGANQSGHIDEVGMEAFAEILHEIAEENRLTKNADGN
jgi:transcription-repair coupling factor (superfamily II helicase)